MANLRRLAPALLGWVVMTDVALSILALIAGGLTLELFVPVPVSGYREQQSLSLGVDEALEEVQAGNPS